MLLYWRFSHEIEGFEERADNENVTPADYAVEVRGIPEDATDEVRKERMPCVYVLTRGLFLLLAD